MKVDSWLAGWLALQATVITSVGCHGIITNQAVPTYRFYLNTHTHSVISGRLMAMIHLGPLDIAWCVYIKMLVGMV